MQNKLPVPAAAEDLSQPGLDNVLPFVSTLWNAINDSTLHSLRWDNEGTAMIIEPVQDFIDHALQPVFGHRTIASFTRQLNYHDFFSCTLHDKLSRIPEQSNSECYPRSRRARKLIYAHPFFVRNRPDQLGRVVRRTNRKAKQALDEQRAAKLKARQDVRFKRFRAAEDGAFTYSSVSFPPQNRLITSSLNMAPYAPSLASTHSVLVQDAPRSINSQAVCMPRCYPDGLPATHVPRLTPCLQPTTPATQSGCRGINTPKEWTQSAIVRNAKSARVEYPVDFTHPQRLIAPSQTALYGLPSYNNKAPSANMRGVFRGNWSSSASVPGSADRSFMDQYGVSSYSPAPWHTAQPHRLNERDMLPNWNVSRQVQAPPRFVDQPILSNSGVLQESKRMAEHPDQIKESSQCLSYQGDPSSPTEQSQPPPMLGQPECPGRALQGKSTVSSALPWLGVETGQRTSVSQAVHSMPWMGEQLRYTASTLPAGHQMGSKAIEPPLVVPAPEINNPDNTTLSNENIE